MFCHAHKKGRSDSGKQGKGITIALVGIPKPSTSWSAVVVLRQQTAHRSVVLRHFVLGIICRALPSCHGRPTAVCTCETVIVGSYTFESAYLVGRPRSVGNQKGGCLAALGGFTCWLLRIPLPCDRTCWASVPACSWLRSRSGRRLSMP